MIDGILGLRIRILRHISLIYTSWFDDESLAFCQARTKNIDKHRKPNIEEQCEIQNINYSDNDSEI